jgi:predicted acetyltransferase
MLTEPRRLRQTLGDGLWVRIVDVPGALEGRTYAAAGRVVVSLEDQICPWNSGSWVIDTTGANASVSRTDESPEIRLTASDLAGVYLGGFTLAQMARAGRVEPSDALARLDGMIHTDVAPYCSGTF